MKPFKQTLVSGAVLLALSLVFTSCDDILGEWDKPTPVTPGGGSGEGGGSDEGGGGTTPSATKTAGSISYASATLTRGTKDPAFTFELSKTGDGTVTYTSSNTAVADVDENTGEITTKGVEGTTTITATVADSEGYTYATKTASYDLTLQSGYSFINSSGNTEVVSESNCESLTGGTSSMSLSSTTKKFVVQGTQTVGGGIGLDDNTEILLCDGAELKITDNISYNYSPINLTVYAQSNGANKGKITISPSSHIAIKVQDLYIYGGEISAESTSKDAIYVNNMYVYGGEAFAKGGNGNAGVYCSSALYVYGNGKLEAIGGNSTTSKGGDGVKCKTDGTGNAFVSGNAVLIAKGGDGEGWPGGFGVNAWPCTSGNCEFTATGGNSSNTTAGYGVNKLQYEGGKVTIMAGTGTSGGAVYNSTFGSSMNTVFEQTTNGTDWTDFNVIYGDNSSSGKLGIRKIN